jgi:parvin
MAVPRPKSPRPIPLSLKEEKDETFWDKIGTITRRKRERAAKEGKYGRQIQKEFMF